MEHLKALYQESQTKNRTRSTILRRAGKLFADQGIDGVTMVDVAKACDMTIRNLYRYYAHKSFLVIDVAYDHLIRVEALMSAVDPLKSGYEQLKSIMDLLTLETHRSIEKLTFFKFIMAFDLYITKLEKKDEAYERYTKVYVPKIETRGHEVIESALVKGLKDGSLWFEDDKISDYAHYITQSLFSIAMRVAVKQDENPSINQTLVEQHKALLLNHLQS